MLKKGKGMLHVCSSFFFGTSKYSSGNFYIMHEQDPIRKQTLRIKFGITVNDPYLRKRKLQTGNPNLLKLDSSWEVTDMGKVENWFKDLLDQNKIQQGPGGKEWREVSLDTMGLLNKCLFKQLGSPIPGTLSYPPKLIMGRGNLQKKGYIYIISEENDLHGCRVKVGATERDPTERVAELQTGNSNRLTLDAYVAVKNMALAETRIHEAMIRDNLRQGITGGTEWFKCESVEEAKRYFDLIQDLKTLQRSKSSTF